MPPAAGAFSAAGGVSAFYFFLGTLGFRLRGGFRVRAPCNPASVAGSLATSGVTSIRAGGL